MTKYYCHKCNYRLKKIDAVETMIEKKLQYFMCDICGRCCYIFLPTNIFSKILQDLFIIKKKI